MDEEDEEEVRGNTVAEFRWLSQLDDDSTTKKICSTTVSEMIDKDVWINILNIYNCFGYRIIYIELIPLVQPAPYLLRGISSKVKVKERSGLRAPAVLFWTLAWRPRQTLGVIALRGRHCGLVGLDSLYLTCQLSLIKCWRPTSTTSFLSSLSFESAHH